MDIEKTIRSYLPQVVHLSLSTSRDNKPWTCEVHFVFDDQLNLYFSSKPSRRHSQEIADNTFVSGTIVTQHFLKQKVRGVYFEGKAQRLTNVDENHSAYLCFAKRFGAGPDMLKEAQEPDGHTFYQISVENYYLFDSYESSPSQKYHLPWGKNPHA